MKKKILCILLSCVMLSGFVACAQNTPTEDPSDTPQASETVAETTTEEKESMTLPQQTKEPVLTGEGKTIDLYLIAGQSNAGGHTRITDAEAVYAQYPELKTGFTNVHYSGTARRGGKNDFNIRTLYWMPTRLGLGRTNDTYMGPEAGMAVALSEYYNKETGKQAGIIKFAHGGTSIFDNLSGDNYYGNWLCPSYAQELNIAYLLGSHGALYRGLLKQVETSVRDLQEYGGYTNVNLKGIYWMQGCNDRGNPELYERIIQLLFSDLRRDLSALMLELSGGITDCGASELPVFIGTISETFLNAEESTITTNRTFIAMQKGLASKIDRCTVIDNSGYAINRWDTESGQSVVVGSDQYHWNQSDALAIGQAVGKKMLEICVDQT